MDAVNWLLAANIIIWLGIGVYVAFIAIGQRKLAIRLKQLEIMANERRQ